MRRSVTVVAVAALLLLAAALPAAAGGRRPRCEPCQKILPKPLPECPLEFAPVDDPDVAPKALVFSGGGVKGVAYPGAIGVLAASGGYDGVERVAGTSAGSLIALVAALGYTPPEMCGVVLDVDFAAFEDGSGFFGDLKRLKRDYGIFAGEHAFCLLQCLVKEKLDDPLATFGDLEAAIAAGEKPGLRRLYTVGTDLNLSRSEVYSIETTPDVPLALAARISMSIPLFFAAVRSPELRTPGTFPLEEGEVAEAPAPTDVWVDGGVLRNYPIGIFDRDDGTADPRVLGFSVGGGTERREIRNLRGYVERLVSTVLNSQIDALCRSAQDVRRTVFIDPLGIGTTDFELTRQQIVDLMKSGEAATTGYLSGEIPTSCPERMMTMTHEEDFETFSMDGDGDGASGDGGG